MLAILTSKCSTIESILAIRGDPGACDICQELFHGSPQLAVAAACLPLCHHLNFASEWREYVSRKQVLRSIPVV